jgi:GTPase
MHFVDECQLRAEAGRGGNGAMAFNREKFIPFGGPAGGDGGQGGHVIFVGDSGKTTLSDIVQMRTLRAERGENGQGRDKYGRGGRSCQLFVPLGTIVYDRDTGEKLGEIMQPKQELIVAKGGAGGRGNLHFATPTDKAPRRADPGGLGQVRNLRLELKVMADVGLLGLPNVGKSTLIRSISRARPRVADYPFTTLEPHLGVVSVGDGRAGLGASFVVADIPGLVPGASQGTGLGFRFLRHVERTRVLLHLISWSPEPDHDPMADYLAIRRELGLFSEKLSAHPEIVVMTKADLTEVVEAFPKLEQRFAELGIPLLLISAATHQGVDAVLRRVVETLARTTKSTEPVDSDSAGLAGTESKPAEPAESDPGT